eukprot:TRINITY_DN8493_c0_g1_i1.p1 TRINITY_DN8493_c0_g1~~TRINITY_DN8493_c0_g1_i1.p1  ORF type:complete len:296 (+),score=41.85 TRINITY_DN8493_c0_g1_i1:87-974(+)
MEPLEFLTGYTRACMMEWLDPLSTTMLSLCCRATHRLFPCEKINEALLMKYGTPYLLGLLQNRDSFRFYDHIVAAVPTRNTSMLYRFSSLIQNNRALLNELMKLAAFHGNVPLMKKVTNWGWKKGSLNNDKNLTASPLAKAVEGGHSAAIQYLISLGCHVHRKLFPLAIKSKNIETMRLLKYKYNCDHNLRDCSIAAVNSGSKKPLKLLYEWGQEFDRNTMSEAIRAGNIKAVRWLKSVGCPYDEESFFLADVVEKGNTEMIQYLSEWCKLSLSPRILEHAAAFGHPRIRHKYNE